MKSSRKVSLSVVSARMFVVFAAIGLVSWSTRLHAEEKPLAGDAAPKWQFDAEQLQPFWQGETMHGESVLFIKDSATGEARASVLFPIDGIVSVRNSAGDVTYEEGKDFTWKPGSRDITAPADSKIPCRTPDDLRRPAKTQPYQLTHRDGNGEIFFGGRLEYADMQTCITYRHKADLWKPAVPKFDPSVLLTSITKLRDKQPLSIVVLGDSISAGANASKLSDAAPFQPAYPELVQQQLEHCYQGKVTLTNLSVGGTDTAWGIGEVDKVIAAKPDLLIVAFGMNDSSGRPAAEYQANIRTLLEKVRERAPECEFILVAPMLGNRNWTALRPELFPQYRDKLKEMTGPGVALADLTSVWTEFLELKQDWDQTGNGVNHPNDFGHRVYAQVICSLLIPPEASAATQK